MTRSGLSIKKVSSLKSSMAALPETSDILSPGMISKVRRGKKEQETSKTVWTNATLKSWSDAQYM